MFDGCGNPSAEGDYEKAQKKVLEDLLKKTNFFGVSADEPFGSKFSREYGNWFYKQGKFFMALSYYSRALAYAEEGSEDAALALANRSAVLLAVGYFKECVSDANLALSKNYPEALAYKLHQRLATCHTMLGDKVQAALHFELCCKLIKQHVPSAQQNNKLSSAKSDCKNGVPPKVKRVSIKYKDIPESVAYGEHPDFPGVSSALKMVDKPNFGKHFVAQRKIKIGDILMIEEPLVSSLIEKEMHGDEKCSPEVREQQIKELETNYTFCYHCFKNCLTLTPCKNCYFAMFCSEKCREDAENAYHKVECSARMRYAACRSSDDLTSNSIMVVVCCKMVATFGVDACIQAMADPANAQGALGKVLGMTQAVYALEIVMRTKNLALQIAANCFGVGGTKKKRLAEFIVLALMIYKHNSASATFPQYHAETDIFIPNFVIGWGLFLNNSYLMHSCAPNTHSVTYQGKVLVRLASVPIKPGETITTTYVSSSATSTSQDVEGRKALIKQTYHFTCKCVACTNGWYPKSYLEDFPGLFKKFPKLQELMASTMDHVNCICNFQGLDTLMDKSLLRKCYEIQKTFAKAGIPSFDHFSRGISNYIENHNQYSAIKFLKNGQGEHYLFAPNTDMDAKAKKIEADMAEMKQQDMEEAQNAEVIHKQWMSQPKGKRQSCACPTCKSGK